MNSDLLHPVASAPPVAITGLTLMGVGLSDWVMIVTLLWLALQIGYFVYSKFFKKPKE